MAVHYLAAFWPAWTEHVSWLWRNGDSYNLFSSEIGGLLVKVPLLIYVLRKFECHVTGCHKHGHPVVGTAYRACKKHHPKLETGRVTAHTISEAKKVADRH